MTLTLAAKQLQELLDLKWPPISITFRKDPPTDVLRIDQSAPSGCSYWKLAAEGKTFYTEASDHYACPIGAYTHGVDLPAQQGKELEGMIETMVGLSYLKMEEVPLIPRRDDSFGFAIYGPLADTTFEPDVVIVRGKAKQMMLLAEAANAVGVSSSNGIMGRPTCAMIPAVMKSQQSVMSLGCMGNRVYNELGDDELYFAVANARLDIFLESVYTLCQANAKLEEFHRTKVEQFR